MAGSKSGPPLFNTAPPTGVGLSRRGLPASVPMGGLSRSGNRWSYGRKTPEIFFATQTECWLRKWARIPKWTLRRDSRPSARTAAANSSGAKVLIRMSRRYALDRPSHGSVPHVALRAFSPQSFSRAVAAVRHRDVVDSRR